MSATRVPRIAEFRELFFVGPVLGDIFDAFGIEDSDLPEIVPDDLDFEDMDALARCFPKVMAKLEALEP